nr:sterol desaturase family protein [Parvularcula mediterranea]
MYLTIATIALLGLWLAAERLRPAFSSGQGGGRIVRNVLLGVVGLGATFAIVTPVSLTAAQFGAPWRETWPMWVRVLTDLFILEFFIYWWHRANHEVPFLWRFHRVHHYDGFLDVTSALRFHPGEVILSALVRGVYVLLFDVSVPAILIFDAAVVIAAGFHHSNLRLGQKADDVLRKVVVSPDHHRIHHIPERRYTDSNYGTLTTFFDRFFGSYEEAPRKGAYGVEGAEDKPFTDLMTDPFRSPST